MRKRVPRRTGHSINTASALPSPMQSASGHGRVLTIASHPDLSDPSTRLLMPTAEQGPFLPFDRFAQTVAMRAESLGRHPHLAEEVVVYVLEGSVRHEGEDGSPTVLGPGSVVVLTAHDEIRHALIPEAGTVGASARWLSIVLRLPWHTEPPPTALQIRDAGEATEGIEGVTQRPLVGRLARADSSMGLECTDLEFTRRHDLRFPVGLDRRGVAYVLRGTGSIEKQTIAAGQGALLDHVGLVTLSGTTGFRVFLSTVPVSGDERTDDSVEGRITTAEYPGDRGL